MTQIEEKTYTFFDNVTALVKKCKCLDYTLGVFLREGHIYMQGSYIENDIITGKPEVQKTRKWLISENMTPSEIVQTAFKLCLTSMEHRCREGFTYKEARIFGPHYDVEDLVTLAKERGDAGGRPS